MDIIYATSQSNRTKQAVELSKVPPTPTLGGTITPSGALFGTDPENRAKLFANEPKAVGGFVLDDPYRSSQAYQIPTTLGVITPSGEYAVEFWFETSSHEAYLHYLAIVDQLSDGLAIVIADNGFVSAKGLRYVAALHYRNIAVIVRTPQEWYYSSTKTPPPVRLTDDQIIAVLNDIYSQILKQ